MVAKKKNNFGKEKLSPLTAVLLAVLIAYVAIMCLMFLWAVMTSFKSPAGYHQDKVGFPTDPYFNYLYVFSVFEVTMSGVTHSMLRMLGNSLLYALGCSLAKATVTCVVAYLSARYAYKFSKVVYTIVIVSMVTPVVGSLPSELQMAMNLGLYNSIPGQWVMKCNFLGMYFLVFYEFFKSMPKSYTEAAEIDGASDWKILTSIAFPLVSFTFLSVVLIYFIEYWNDYQIPLAFMPDQPTLAYGMYFLANGAGVNELKKVPYIMTMAIMVLVPILVLFLCCHKRLLGNLNVGGIKG
ncbi:MAG: carbohydrate ABC transporter permease [Clostridia bacterium]|nr:carbohydrate ABC transporter permease [Clostridia bacterium]